LRAAIVSARYPPQTRSSRRARVSALAALVAAVLIILNIKLLYDLLPG
jgi:hypothetical protein